MKLLSTLLIATMVCTQSFALEVLSDSALQEVEGQAGADLSLKLSLNQKMVDGKYVFDNGAGAVCEKVEYCRLAVAVNNRYVEANGQASSTGGHKL